MPAKVSLISPALDPGSTTMEIWLKADNKKGTLKVGTPVKVSITGRTVENALKVPVSAILTAQDGSKSVMVVGADGAAHKKPVRLGIQDGDDIQITQGLTTSRHGHHHRRVRPGRGHQGQDRQAADEDEDKPAADKGGDKD